MTYAEATDLMCEASNVQLTKRQATLSYGLSKMTVKNEMEKGLLINPYKRLAYVEFLEYIGRVAAEKYKTSSQSLSVKIEKVLDDILPLVGASRKEI